MPKKMISILMAALLLCVSLTGCTKMVSLTDEEEEEIAIYTSSLISKYNRTQTNGLTYISEQRRLEIEEAEASYHPTETDTEEQVPEDGSVDASTDPTVTGIPDGSTGSLTGATGPTESMGGEDATGITLTDLVGIDGLSVSYQGATAAANYGADGVFDISPTKGYQYLVMNFQLKNTSSSPVGVDFESSDFVFRATVDGVTARADQTILLEDFQTFTGTIGAGETQKVVLLFQYPKDGLTDLSNLSLRVEQGGNTYTVVL
ncbi:MAG: DUF4352 domain-containing protein [Lachnospiraceae bacterium]|nr:DUF4352 domain-containing protein [Lachnospiraceae bacterium]